jgi:hypothetical protein
LRSEECVQLQSIRPFSIADNQPSLHSNKSLNKQNYCASVLRFHPSRPCRLPSDLIFIERGRSVSNDRRKSGIDLADARLVSFRWVGVYPWTIPPSSCPCPERQRQHMYGVFGSKKFRRVQTRTQDCFPTIANPNRTYGRTIAWLFGMVKSYNCVVVVAITTSDSPAGMSIFLVLQNYSTEYNRTVHSLMNLPVMSSDASDVRFSGKNLGCVYFLKKKILCKQRIPRHIKLTIHAWSTKCR